MKSKIILVDMDGVLANFEDGFLTAWRKKYPKLPSVPIVERKAFHIRDDYPKEYLSKIESIYFAKGFLLNLKPLDGAIEALKEMESLGYKLFICTSPLNGNQYFRGEKITWVKNYFGQNWLNNLIITREKSLVEGDYLIDDKPEIKNIITPKWEQIIFDAPYNRNVTNKKRLLKWSEWRKVIK